MVERQRTTNINWEGTRRGGYRSRRLKRKDESEVEAWSNHSRDIHEVLGPSLPIFSPNVRQITVALVFQEPRMSSTERLPCFLVFGTEGGVIEKLAEHDGRGRQRGWATLGGSLMLFVDW